MNNIMNLRNLIFSVLIFFSTWLIAVPVKVACGGNSVTFGYLIDNVEGKYPSQLQRMLGENYEVKNFGHSGATLLNKGHRPYINLLEFQDALQFNPDIVIIHLGLNDTDPRNWPKLRDNFVTDYTNLIDTFKSINPYIDIKICRMTPIFTGHSRFKSSTRDWYWQIQKAIETVAKINNVELIDLNTPLYRRPDLFPDALHPTEEGAKIIAETVYGAITQNYGGLKLASVFSDAMVLQRNRPVTFWGTANGGTDITVQFNNLVKTTSAGKDGKWDIEFPSLKEGGPYKISVENESSKIVLNDILIGDVWLCSGQSNMEFKLNQAASAYEDIPAANYKNIRLLNMIPVDYTNNVEWDSVTLQKVNRLDYFSMGDWQHCSPETAKNFSAIAYHFGRKIYEETNIPIGLILNAVGGSPTEAWIDRYSLEHSDRLVDMFQNWNNNDYINPWCRERGAKNTELSSNKLQRHPYHPSYLYEAGVEQLTKSGIAGVIWYQGESNEQNVELHEVLFPKLVESWRNVWGYEFPFYYVQLSSMAVGRETWGHFRDSQRRLLSIVPNSGMVVSSDHGDSTDVHPREKKQVGERLARLALNKTYGMKKVTPSGPLFKDVEFKGDTAIVSFDFSEGLKTSDSNSVKSFELAEYPGLYFPAKADIIGDKIKVSSNSVKNPRYVRYGWQSFSGGNLVNNVGLPASTFTSEELMAGYKKNN